MVVPKCFIKHMCFIVLYFHGHAFFSLEIAKKCFFVLYFLKNVLYFCTFFKWVNIYFKFLGGLSLHLNHLIGSRVTNYDWQFGTLPLGLFWSNLDTMDLETYPRSYSDHF